MATTTTPGPGTSWDVLGKVGSAKVAADYPALIKAALDALAEWQDAWNAQLQADARVVLVLAVPEASRPSADVQQGYADEAKTAAGAVKAPFDKVTAALKSLEEAGVKIPAEFASFIGGTADKVVAGKGKIAEAVEHAAETGGGIMAAFNRGREKGKKKKGEEEKA